MGGKLILAIESSCDETSAAVLLGTKVLSNEVVTQLQHAQYGGVVPEIASRAHQTMITAVVHAALKTAGKELRDLEVIAVTQGPGLMGSLLVGISFAKSLSLALGIPLVGVNHMQAHILAHLADDCENKPTFPFLNLTVSGGHTQLVVVYSPIQMEVIGETIDDAAGEAFDKSAKLLGLDYPGGAALSRLANSPDEDAIAAPLDPPPTHDDAAPANKPSAAKASRRSKSGNAAQSSKVPKRTQPAAEDEAAPDEHIDGP